MGGGASLEGSSLGLHFEGEGEELMVRMGSGQKMVVVRMNLIQSIVISDKMRITPNRTVNIVF